MIRRSPLPPRTKPMRKTNPKRRQSEFAKAYHSRERVAFVKSLGCVYCTFPFIDIVTAGESHNAHTVTGGMGRKADYTTIIPLCPAHHRGYDLHQPPMDSSVVRDALASRAAEVERRWQEYNADTRATA